MESALDKLVAAEGRVGELTSQLERARDEAKALWRDLGTMIKVERELSRLRSCPWAINQDESTRQYIAVCDELRLTTSGPSIREVKEEIDDMLKLLAEDNVESAAS